jgi:hypothetical protein
MEKKKKRNLRKNNDTDADIIKSFKFGTISLYDENLMDDYKIWSKFIKKIESIVRRSLEQKNYIRYLKDECNMNTDIFFRKIQGDKDSSISIELHHYPLSLYDITEIVAYDMIVNGEEVSTFLIANKVVELHFKNVIGLVPLSITTHQMAHSGRLLIPMSAVFGMVKDFLKEYKRSISSGLLEKIERVINASDLEVKNANIILKEKICFNPNLSIEYNDECLKLIDEIKKEREVIEEEE